MRKGSVDERSADAARALGAGTGGRQAGLALSCAVTRLAAVQAKLFGKTAGALLLGEGATRTGRRGRRAGGRLGLAGRCTVAGASRPTVLGGILTELAIQALHTTDIILECLVRWGEGPGERLAEIVAERLAEGGQLGVPDPSEDCHQRLEPGVVGREIGGSLAKSSELALRCKDVQNS